MASPVHRAETDETTDYGGLDYEEPEIDPREEDTRLNDNLELIRAERLVSQEVAENGSKRTNTRRHDPEPEDAFNTTGPSVTPTSPNNQNNTWLSRTWRRIKRFPRVFRFFLYMTPPGVILLTPILLDLYAYKDKNAPVGGPGGLRLLWFGIWLEIIWLSLWVSRVVTSTLPYIFGKLAKAVGSSNHQKWKNIGRELDIPAALFTWTLALLCSFRPITDSHRDPSGDWSNGLPYVQWIEVMWKVLITIFVLAASNLVEKIAIQWIAFSFHLRTYASRIAENERNVTFLVRLYEYARGKNPKEIPLPTSAEVYGYGGNTMSGARTPLQKVTAGARQAWGQVGFAANRMAGDLTGRKVMGSNHPRKIISELLRDTSKSHALARQLFRVLSEEGAPVRQEDVKPAFGDDEEAAEACFIMFDRDFNGDVSMEEMEGACNEIHLEIKAISMSLKDLDSVVRKLDKVFLFIIFIIALIVFISIYSGSAAAALGTSGTTILGLSWMLQATAQEFLQSVIFVFVKHPFDVGDRVTIYGNSGSVGRGDDYYVQEISLLYTEFKKMEGHIVQAPNSLLNTLFILNQRRSPSLADPIELKLAFGTSAQLIQDLETAMLEFVLQNKRDYSPRIITEVRTIDEVWSVTINFIFFHKSNFQNELLRLQRHNKFAAELMRQMTLLGIEGPRKMEPGGTKTSPFYYSAVAPGSSSGNSNNPFPPAPDNASLHQASPVEPSTNVWPHSSTRHHPTLSTIPQSTTNTNPNATPNNAGNNTAPYSPISEARRHRAESAARMMDTGPSFNDVFGTRRDQQQPSSSQPAAFNRDITRLQSVREFDRTSSTSRGRRGSVMGERVTGASLEQIRTNATGKSGSVRKRGFFGGVTGGGRGNGEMGRQRSISQAERSREGGDDYLLEKSGEMV